MAGRSSAVGLGCASGEVWFHSFCLTGITLDWGMERALESVQFGFESFVYQIGIMRPHLPVTPGKVAFCDCHQALLAERLPSQ